MLGVKRTATNWADLRECGHEPLQFYWFRSVVKLQRIVALRLGILGQYFHITIAHTCNPYLSWYDTITSS
jgi:hypothetical protein